MAKFGWRAVWVTGCLLVSVGCASESVIGSDEPVGAHPEGLVTALSCEQRCEQVLTSPGEEPFSCSCAASCVTDGDCCADAASLCPAVAGGAGCSASCGGRSPDGCYCDEACESYGDCCGDHQLYCGEQRLLVPASPGLSPVGLYADPVGRAHFGLNKGTPIAPVGADLYRTEGNATWLSQSFSGAVQITDVQGNGPDVWTAIRFTDSIMSGGVTIAEPGTHVLLLRRDYEDTPRATVVSPAVAPLGNRLADQLTVDDAGNVYLLSNRAADGRSVVYSYTNTGVLRWQRVLPLAGSGDLAFGGSSVFVVLQTESGEDSTLTAVSLKAATGASRWTRTVASGVGGAIADVVADATGFVFTGSLAVLDFGGVGAVFCGGGDPIGCATGNGSFLASYDATGAPRFAQPLVARLERHAGDLTDLAWPRLALEPGTGRIVAAAQAIERGDRRMAIGYFHADGAPCWFADFPSSGLLSPWTNGVSVEPTSRALRVLGATGWPELLGAAIPSAPVPRAYVLDLPAPPDL